MTALTGIQYIPSNGSDGADFMDRWCSHCARDKLLNGSVEIDNCRDEAEYNEAQEARRVEKLRKLGARLAELLDEDQFAECEALLLAAGVMPEEKDNVAKA